MEQQEQERERRTRKLLLQSEPSKPWTAPCARLAPLDQGAAKLPNAAAVGAWRARRRTLMVELLPALPAALPARALDRRSGDRCGGTAGAAHEH